MNHNIVASFLNIAKDYIDENMDFGLYKHTRLESDIDAIHIDSPADISALVYLSNTNLNSSTRFYDSIGNVSAEVKFLQNRAVFFTASMHHMSFRNHGDHLSNGRTTLNFFGKY